MLCVTLKKAVVVCFLLVVSATTSGSLAPPIFEKAAYARWMVSSLDWGVASTMSTLWPGYAFGNPVSFADVDGKPVFCVSPLDASVRDLQTNPKMTLTLSEAEGDAGACQGPQGDPEAPPCARLVLAGDFRNVTDNDWHDAARALAARHPIMTDWGCFGGENKGPSDHDFFLATLQVENIWLINIYGGAAVIDAHDYFNTTVFNATTVL